jgi:septum formation protein
MNINELIKLDVPVVLASASPRRKHLLSLLNINFKVETADINEDSESDIPPEAYCLNLAFAKAEKVAKKQKEESLVIGADTIVVLDEHIINKPKDKEDAFKILQLLSNNTHKVYTGIAIINSATKEWITNYQVTDVTFRKLSDDEIWAYIESGSPMDKAGAYGIQDDFGAIFVSNISGCYYNIVGLPLEMLYSTLLKFLSRKDEEIV